MKVSKIGTDGVRVTTNTLGDDEADKVQAAVATAYGVGPDDVSTSTVGPTWGNDVSNKALQGLIVFMIAVSILIALYFHTWKMAASAVLALVHDLILTVGIYAIVGFEITPASVIGFLTILGYSLYDTVVVFDKVRENTEHIDLNVKRTYGEAANRAVNQTLIRSINTSVVALLPVASILFIGAFILGAGTLKDLSLALFVGIAAGTYSSIFIATPMLVHLREREPEMAAQAERVLRKRSEDGARRRDATPPRRPTERTASSPLSVPRVRRTRPDGSAVAEDAGSSGTRAQSGGQRQQPRRGGPNPARKNNRQGGRR